jgi:4-hydroxy-tetrahydrodipicolinate synthase
MAADHAMQGALAPVVTPFKADLSPDADKLIRLCRRLIEQDCGLAVFGTNSEGNSLTVDEKIALLDRLVEAGLPTERMMPGTGHCAIPDTVRLTRHAVGLGCGGVLMLPPFYYKGVSDEGLFRAFAEVIERVGDDRLRVYLYHIPPVAQVGIGHDLIARLIDAFPGVVAGIKDSSNDWENTKAMLERFPGWGIFCGAETWLVDARRLGARGTISAMCNINAPAIAGLIRDWRSPEAGERQKRANRFRATVSRYPTIPALKAVVGRSFEDAEWGRMRPPLVELTAEQRSGLFADLDALAAEAQSVPA